MFKRILARCKTNSSNDEIGAGSRIDECCQTEMNVFARFVTEDGLCPAHKSFLDDGYR